MSTPRIGYAGMTHLGLCSGIAAASKGFETVCFDPDAARIAVLRTGALPVIEPELPELLAAHKARVTFTSDPTALAACDVVYVAPDVPTDDRGGSDLAPLEALLGVVDGALRDDAVLVILSQVPPGFTRARLRPGRILHYQVETLVFGRAVERATLPERFIVGCADPAKALPPAYAAFLTAFDCPILPMRLESAELAKISINMCLVASVSVTNVLADLCERIDADWSEIAPALKLDKRIGPFAYLAPGLGLAGGNLERDLTTVLNLAVETGSDAGVVAAFVADSKRRKDWALRTLHRELLSRKPDAVLGILGLAYKENTHSIKNSPSLALIEQLGDWRLKLYDPAVPASAVRHSRAEGVAAALDVADGVDGLVVMTPWPAFRQLSAAELARRMRGRIVIDPYHVIDATAAVAAGLRHHALGRPVVQP
jgi:UDPglucose 6-dehydrogenase